MLLLQRLKIESLPNLFYHKYCILKISYFFCKFIQKSSCFLFTLTVFISKHINSAQMFNLLKISVLNIYNKLVIKMKLIFMLLILVAISFSTFYPLDESDIKSGCLYYAKLNQNYIIGDSETRDFFIILIFIFP